MNLILQSIQASQDLWRVLRSTERFRLPLWCVEMCQLSQRPIFHSQKFGFQKKCVGERKLIGSLFSWALNPALKHGLLHGKHFVFFCKLLSTLLSPRKRDQRRIFQELFFPTFHTRCLCSGSARGISMKILCARALLSLPLSLFPVCPGTVMSTEFSRSAPPTQSPPEPE